MKECGWSLLRYIEEQGTLAPELLDSLRYHLDRQVNYYGRQFRFPYEHYSMCRAIMAEAQWLRNAAAALLKPGCGGLENHAGKTIVSNAYFGVQDDLSRHGYRVVLPAWSARNRNVPVCGSRFLRFAVARCNHTLTGGLFKNIISPQFIRQIHALEELLERNYRALNAAALVVPNDMSFFENLSIRIFRRMKKPSFVFLHGLPGRYNSIDDNRADHLVVWGEAIKRHYMAAGVDNKKIHVSGHPLYRGVPSGKLRCSLDDVLVLTKSMNGGNHGTDVILSDRGNCALYLVMLQDILKQCGVSRARIRPHPSENKAWYRQFIDMEFWVEDDESVQSSLTRSSLVIGPTSTMFLESLWHGVNYMIFEPLHGGASLDNYPLVCPFDGSDPRIPVAHDAVTLVRMLREGTRPDMSFWADYVSDGFDVGFMTSLL